MKTIKFIFLLSVVCICSTIYTQTYHPFIAENKFIKISNYPDLMPFAFDIINIYHFDGDTTIASKVYKKLYARDLSCCPEYAYYLASLLREDTLEKKVYIFLNSVIYKDYPCYNTEQVLYDFSLEVGDSLISYTFQCCNFPKNILYVSSKENIILEDGSSVTKINFNFSGNPLPKISIIERIGSEEIFFDPILLFHVENDYTINCVNENGTRLLPSSECIGLKVEETKSISNLIHIFSNCIKNQFIVESKLTSATLTIYDLQGKAWLTQELREGVNTIDCLALPQGVYVYKVISSQVQTEGKIIKTIE